MSAEIRPTPAHLAVALAAAVAMLACARGLVEPAAAAETHYLALWASLILIVVAGLAVTPAWDLAAAAVGVTLLIWTLPHGPTRGAAVGLLLTIALVVVAARHLERIGRRPTWGWTLAAALGLQLLFRADRLLMLGLEPRFLIGIVAVAGVAALALLRMQREEGTARALLATATAALLVPGWSVSVTLSLASVALGLGWREDRTSRRWIAGLELAVLLAALWWQPVLAPLLLLAFMAAAHPRDGMIGLAALATLVALLALLPAARDWSEVLRLLALGPLLLPALLLPAEGKRLGAVQGLTLAVLALRTVAGPGALAAPLALVALALRPEGVAARLQKVWTAVLLVASALLSAYPWLRTEALADALALFGLRIAWLDALLLVLLIWSLSLLCAAVTERRARFQCPAEVVGATLLAIAAWLVMPAPGERPFGGRVVALTAARPRVSAEIDPPAAVRSVVLDSYLDHSARLAAGTTVGRVVLIGTDGERRSVLLRAGHDTGEWAARRADVAGLPGFQAPPHWLAWVAPGGNLFAQRYRSRWRLDDAWKVRRIRLERAGELATEISMAVFHMELRR